MKSDPKSFEDIKVIRKIMEESTRFLSLSGLSGVFAGITAIAGAILAYLYILDNGTIGYNDLLERLPDKEAFAIKWQLIVVAAAVLLFAILFALFFSIRKARREGKKFMTPISQRLLLNLFVPLAAGAVFVFALMVQGCLDMVIPGFLVFYGLALVNAGKFTFGEIFYLGLLEMVTGLIAAFVPGTGLLFWIIGFGILHIIYGVAMYVKYEK